MGLSATCKLIFSTSTAHLTGVPATPEGDRALRDISLKMSYFYPGYENVPSFRAGKWDGRVRLFKPGNHGGTFPTGLSSIAAHILNEYNIQCTFIDNRYIPQPDVESLEWTGHDLRDYQTDGIRAALSSSRGIWHVGTGGGKMLLAARLFYETRLPGMILVNTQEAVLDTLAELKSSISGCSIGCWYGDRKEPGYITVATVHSLFTKRVTETSPNGQIKKVKRPPHPELVRLLQRSQVLVIDEVHHGGAGQWYDIAQTCPAYYKIGQTGTPTRSDDKEILLMAATGRVLISKPARELQDEGWLSPSRVVFYESPPPSGFSNIDYVMKTAIARYHDAIVRNEPRNRLIRQIIQDNPDRSFLCTVRLVEHGKILSSMLDVPFVTGSISKKLRREIKSRLESGELRGVVATNVYDESVNIPRLNMLINAGGQSPENAQTQRHGRILRNEGGEALFVDFNDSWASDVARHSRNRIKYMRGEGHEVKIEAYAPSPEIVSKGSLLEVI